MGAQTARDLAEMSTDNIEQAIQWHLMHNHFPPVPASMVEPCIQAIDAINEFDYKRLIALPDGVGYKGLTVAPANAIAEAHHLDPWLMPESE